MGNLDLNLGWTIGVRPLCCLTGRVFSILVRQCRRHRTCRDIESVTSPTFLSNCHLRARREAPGPAGIGGDNFRNIA